MRILHLIDSGGLYGAERMLLELGAAQRRAGHEVVVGSIGPIGSDEKPIERAARHAGLGIEPIRMAEGLNPAALGVIRRALTAQEFDVVHGHGYKGNTLLGLSGSWRTRFVKVATLHGWTNLQRWSRLWVYEWLEKQSLRNVDAIAAVSPTFLEGGRLPRRLRTAVRVIANGIAERADPAAAIDDDPRLLRWKQEATPILCAIGRLSPEKGFDDLIKALALLRKRGLTARLLILGEGGERPGLEAAARQAGLTDAVYMPGYRENAAAYLPHCSLFVLSSLTEGLPITLLEAMRIGLPVVSTPVGAVPTVLSQGRAGRLVPPRDPQGLADGLAELLASPVLAARLGAAAQQRFQCEYTVDAMQLRYAELYDAAWQRRFGTDGYPVGPQASR